MHGERRAHLFYVGYQLAYGIAASEHMLPAMRVVNVDHSRVNVLCLHVRLLDPLAGDVDAGLLGLCRYTRSCVQGLVELEL